MATTAAILPMLLAFCVYCEAGLIPFGSLRYRRMSGSTAGRACDYPGVAAITSAGYVICMGIYSKSQIIVPNDCASLLKNMNKNVATTISGGDGTGSTTIAKATIVITDNGDGTSTVKTASAPMPVGSCTTVDYKLYDPAVNTDLDITTCTVVSYASSNSSVSKFTGSLQTALLVTSPLLDCGSLVVANVASTTNTNYGKVNTALYSTGAVTITTTDSAGFCRGDLGAPIFCHDSATGSNVVVGMVASSSCTAGETFLSYDLTKGTLTGFSLA